MKFRMSEVTNSSSTSFIIGSTGDQSLITEITMKVDLSRYSENTIKSLEDLDRWLDDWYGYTPDDVEGSEKEQYEAAKTIIEEGGVVHVLHVSDESDDPMEVMLTHQGLNDLDLPENVKIIRGEGGY